MSHYLTVCERGNVRSVTCAIILKDLYMQDNVIPVGVTTTDYDTLHMLGFWADRIFIMGDVTGIEHFPKLHLAPLVRHLDIGKDVWGQPMNPELVAAIIRELQAKAGFADMPTRWGVDEYQTLNAAAYARRFT